MNDLQQVSGDAGFLTGGGEMGQRIREYDWSKTAIGPVTDWSQSLQSALSICLNSNFPIAIYWGRDLTLLYNDAWSAIPGNKHPWALGQSARNVWPEIWEQLAPQFEMAFCGKPGGSRDALLPMQRHGYTEECYFDFTFTPVLGKNGSVEGIFNAVIETTYRVINERRTAFLHKFSNAIVKSESIDTLTQAAISVLKTNAYDIPFSLIYGISAEGTQIPEASTISDALKSPWPLEELYGTG
ncbi:MAG: two-component system sensor histidine kinase/response regulator, partial [Bacteroidetes bacterium]|nr:two-component system sensor histidine kinase/response regulator [Bacteroidota bacterium]